MNRHIILFLSFTIGLYATSQNWGKTTISQYLNEAMDVEVDATGNSYVTGYITGETAFDPTTIQTSAAGNGDIYVAKYASNGQLLWLKQFGGNFTDRGYDLAIGPDQQIIVTGQYFGQVSFGAVTLNSSSNSKDIFLLKLTASGTVVWARSEGGNMAENAYGVAVDGQNNVLLTGQFQGNSQLGGQPFVSTIDPVTLQPSFDLFLAKYTPTGTPLWVKTGTADYEDRGLAVSTDSGDNIYITGQYSDTLILAGQTFNNAAYNVGMLAKFNPQGQLQWMHSMRAGMVVPYDVEINSVNEPVVTGDYLGTLSFFDANGMDQLTNAYDKRIFVLKTDVSGNYIWGKSLGSDNDVSARSLSIDSQKDIYVTGFFRCGFTQLRESDTSIFYSVGFKDPYLLKIGNNGQLQYAKHFGGQMDDEGHGVAVHTSSQPIICGSFSKNLNLRGNFAVNYQLGIDPHTLNQYGIGSDYLFLQGDSTRNSFLLKAIGDFTPELNYFIESTDYLTLADINQDADTVHFCESGSLYTNTATYPQFGPSYNFLWSDGSIYQGTGVMTSGNYDVIVKRDDVCQFARDTIAVIIHQEPSMPLISDNLGIATLQPPPYPYYAFCAPDSVQIWFNQLDPNATFAISTASGAIITDSLPHFYDQGGAYWVHVTTPYCTLDSAFYIQMQTPIPYDSIDPYLKLYDIVDFNDTLTICAGDPFTVYALDSLTNPTGAFISPTEYTIDSLSWYSTPALPASIHMGDPYICDFYPTVTGWYTIDFHIRLGYRNLCGIDTTPYHVTKPFYIIVNPVPVLNVNIAGNQLICPGDSSYLYTTTPNPVLNWSGPGILWTSNDEDSIQINLPGIYYYSGTIVDTATGCNAYAGGNILILPKTLPNITSNPVDAILCPFDSVLLSLPPTYTSYNWIGPQANTISTTNTAYGDIIGFYYCHVIDNEGCSLTSPPFEVREFTTPFVTAEPGTVICDNESITLTAVTVGNASILWTSPINSTAQTVQVNQPGTYYCQIQQCGTTYLDSVVVIDGSFTVQINTTDSLICYGESVTLFAPPGFASYTWSDGNLGNAILTTSDTGDYFVTVMSPYGCEAVSNTIHVSQAPESTPPNVSGVTVCPGANAQLLSNSPYTTLWFRMDTVFLQSGNSFTLPNVLNDTQLLVAYSSAFCPLVYQTVNITVTDSIPLITIQGDSLLCPEESSQYVISDVTYLQNWMVNNQLYPNTPTITFNATDFAISPVLSAILSNGCYLDTMYHPISFALPDTLSLTEDSLTLCAYTQDQISSLNPMQNINWQGNFGSIQGTDLIVDAQTFSSGWIYATGTDLNGCQTNQDSVYLLVSHLQFTLFMPLPGCDGDSLTLEVQTSTDSLLWTTPFGSVDTNAFSITLSDTTDGWYILQQWDEIGCSYTDSVWVISNPIPVTLINADTLYCIDDLFTYYLPEDSNSYAWSVPGEISSYPITGNQWLELTVTSPEGCIFTDSLYVEAVDCENGLPNVITPNNDGINDFFIIDEAPLFPANELRIMNRWGNLVYSSNGYRNNFNGEGLSDGVYFYVFMRDPKNEPEVRKEGFVQLLR